MVLPLLGACPGDRGHQQGESGARHLQLVGEHGRILSCWHVVLCDTAVEVMHDTCWGLHMSWAGLRSACAAVAVSCAQDNSNCTCRDCIGELSVAAVSLTCQFLLLPVPLTCSYCCCLVGPALQVYQGRPCSRATESVSSSAALTSLLQHGSTAD